MNGIGVTERYSEDLMAEIFDYCILKDKDEVLHGWAIVIDGKFWTKDGRFLYNSRKQLIQTFYNSMRWRVSREIATAEGTLEGGLYGGRATRARIWKEFKQTLEKYHGFKIVQI